MKKQLIIISIFLIISFYNTQAAEYIQAHNKTWDNQVANPDLGGAVFVTSKNILNFTMQKPAGDDSTKCYVYKNATAHGTTDYIYTSTYSGVYCAINGNLTINTAYIFVSTKDFSTNYNQKYTGNLVGLLPVYDNSGRWDMGILDNGANNAFGFITYFFCLEKLIFTVADEQPPENKDSLFIVIDKNSSTNNSVWFNISYVGNFSYIEVFNNSNLLYNGSNNYFNVTGIGNNTQVNFNITGRWNYTLYNNTYFNLTSGQTEQYIPLETFKINISWASPTANFNHTQYTFVDYNFTICCDSSNNSDCTVNVSIDPQVSYSIHRNITADNSSGAIYHTGSDDWATVRDATTGTSALKNLTDLIYVGMGVGSDFYEIWRDFLVFNTTVTNSGNMLVSAARICIKPSSVPVDDYNDGKDYLALVSNNMSNLNNLGIEDYDLLGTTLFSDKMDFGNMVIGNWFCLNLTGDGLNFINLSGFTVLGLKEGHDIENSNVGIPLQYNKVRTYFKGVNATYINVTYYENLVGSKGLINTTSGDLPFYTTDNNPQNGIAISDGVCNIVSFSVNATGTIGDSYKFFGNVTLADNATMNYGTDTINVTITAAQAEDSCTYQGSGTWTILCSDNCIITQTVDLGSNTLLITGEGTTVFTYKPVNFDKMSIHGDSASNICRVRIT